MKKVDHPTIIEQQGTVTQEKKIKTQVHDIGCSALSSIIYFKVLKKPS